jgi:hypothetical protein
VKAKVDLVVTTNRVVDVTWPEGVVAEALAVKAGSGTLPA